MAIFKFNQPKTAQPTHLLGGEKHFLVDYE